MSSLLTLYSGLSGISKSDDTIIIDAPNSANHFIKICSCLDGVLYIAITQFLFVSNASITS